MVGSATLQQARPRLMVLLLSGSSSDRGVASVLQNDPVTLELQVMDVLPRTPAGKRAAWVWRRVLAVAAGAAVPSRREFDEHYGQDWLDEVAIDESFAQMASLAKVMASADPATVLARSGTGIAGRSSVTTPRSTSDFCTRRITSACPTSRMRSIRPSAVTPTSTVHRGFRGAASRRRSHRLESR